MAVFSTRPTLRVALIDQTGAEIGGAQESFALLLAYLPSWVEPHVILFHEGAYAQRLRAAGLDVTIFPVADVFADAKRERAAIAGMTKVPAMVVRLAACLRRRRIDVVYTHTVKAHFVGGPAARLAGIPCIMHLRDILEGGARQALRAIAASCSRERIAISHAVADNYDLSATSIIYNPVDLARFADPPSREEACKALNLPYEPDVPTVGIVGRINRWKGHDRFLRVAAAVSKRARTRFIIAGAAIFRDADFVEELRALRHDLGLTERVHFAPWTDDLRALYAVLDVHCNCSTREPFGRTVIEAAAAGVPTVCFADSGVGETIEDGVNGRVVPSGDEAAFAEAVLDLVRSTDPQRMQSAARELAGGFAPARHAAHVAEIMKRVAA